MEPDQLWLGSDLHLGHANVLKHDQRPFETIEEHDEILIRNFKARGKPGRELWLLGDVAYRKTLLVRFMEAQRSAGWSKICLVRGNHDDRVAWSMRDLFDEAHESRYIRLNREVKLYVSHYAHRTWRNSHHGAYHAYGHSHGALPPWGRSYDVSVNVNVYAPTSMEKIIDCCKDSPSINHHE